jgi:predicted ABC-type ATPase
VSNPNIVLIGGPNGAGKSTIARSVLADLIGLGEFVNADTLAAGLNGFDPERAAFAAGRIMLQRLRELAEARASFAFESTLASRTFAPWLIARAAEGYEINVVFVWLNSPSMAVRRVRARVLAGGHSIPEEVVRRRYARSVVNFVNLYKPIAHRWRVYDNSALDGARIVAGRDLDGLEQVHLPEIWDRIKHEAPQEIK